MSCGTVAANAARLQRHSLAYKLDSLSARLQRPEPIKDWSLTSLKEKLIKIGAKVVSHGRYVVFQMAEVAIPRQIFQEILRLIAELRPQAAPCQHQVFDSHAYKSNPQGGKIAGSTPRPSFELPELPVASATSRRFLQQAGKSAIMGFGTHPAITDKNIISYAVE
jgi:hypothetical protein